MIYLDLTNAQKYLQDAFNPLIARFKDLDYGELVEVSIFNPEGVWLLSLDPITRDNIININFLDALIANTKRELEI